LVTFGHQQSDFLFSSFWKFAYILVQCILLKITYIKEDIDILSNTTSLELNHISPSLNEWFVGCGSSAIHQTEAARQIEWLLYFEATASSSAHCSTVPGSSAGLAVRAQCSYYMAVTHAARRTSTGLDSILIYLDYEN
jgi:hypothetical protein